MVTGGFSGQRSPGLCERQEVKLEDILAIRLLVITAHVRDHHCWPEDPNPAQLQFRVALCLPEERCLSYTV